jgi:hypothetical protein
MASKKSAASKKAAVKEPVVEVEHPLDNEVVALTERDLLSKLTEKLSVFDAEMILESAMLSAGIMRKGEMDLGSGFKRKEVRSICLALIKKGGPAFAVGTAVYREVIG